MIKVIDNIFDEQFLDYINYTLKYNLIPKTISEFKYITIGGAVSGLGIESSSFKYGLVHDMVFELDVLIGTGEIITVNKYKNSDLYFGLPNSYGTFGYIISAKLELIEVKPYVQLTNISFNSPNKFIKEIKKYEKNKNFRLSNIIMALEEFPEHPLWICHIEPIGLA